jgi:hypothetical protein
MTHPVHMRGSLVPGLVQGHTIEIHLLVLGLRRWADLSRSFCFVRRANEVASRTPSNFGALTLLLGEHVAVCIVLYCCSNLELCRQLGRYWCFCLYPLICTISSYGHYGGVIQAEVELKSEYVAAYQ